MLADEVNRATPKTQSALLEAMQERRVTAGRTTHALPEPFFVLATQNPIEMEGTYPLPEAQLDRFLFKLTVPYPSEDDLLRIAQVTTGVEHAPSVTRRGRRDAARADALRARGTGRRTRAALRRPHRAPHQPRDARRAARGQALRPLRLQSPRGLQSLVLGAKVRGLLEGRYNVAYEDIRAVSLASLRHRVILGFEADAEGVTTDKLIHDVVTTTPEE